MRKLMWSFVTVASLSLCFNVQAMDNKATEKETSEKAEKERKRVLSGGLVTAMLLGLTSYTGKVLELPALPMQTAELSLSLAGAGYMFNQKALYDFALRGPLIIAINEIAHWPEFTQALTHVPVVGQILGQMCPEVVAALALVGMYTSVGLDNLEYAKKWVFDNILVGRFPFNSIQ